MSKKFEQIGRISAAVVALPEGHLGIALDMLNKLSDPNWKVRMGEVLREGLKPVVKAGETLLEDMEPVTVVIDTTVNLNNLKITEASNVVEALWVHSDFKKILKEAKDSVPSSVTMKPRRLKKSADGSQIRDALPEECGIDPTAFVYMLITELKKVTAGKESNVLNKNCWCLFMVADLKVLVHWYSSESWWRVKVWEDYICVDAETIVYSYK